MWRRLGAEPYFFGVVVSAPPDHFFCKLFLALQHKLTIHADKSSQVTLSIQTIFSRKQDAQGVTVGCVGY